MTSLARAAGLLAIMMCSFFGTIHAQTLPETTSMNARSSAATIGEETVKLRIGNIFEIIADPGDASATYSWILTQGREFIEASRDNGFRYRFIQDQTYTLRAEVVYGGKRLTKNITIVVLPQDDTTLPTVTTVGTGASLVGVIPEPDQHGRVILSQDQEILQLVPLTDDISQYALDVDTARDTDQDGNPGNDVDDTDTYFHSDGNSLWIWLARDITEVDMAVTGLRSDGGTPLTQKIEILSEETARAQGVLTSPVRITAEETSDGTFTFTPSLVRPMPDGTPLFYEWEFGDGTRSIDTITTHTYATIDTYLVQLHVRDLQTGSSVGSAEHTVVVSKLAGSTGETPIDEPVEPIDEPSTSSLPWGRIALFAGIFIGSLLIGLLIVWLLSFIRRSGKKLEDTLATMEEAVVPATAQTAPPLAIRKPTSAPVATDLRPAQQKVIDAEVQAAAPVKVPTTVTEAAAPDWLKKGLSTPQATPPVAKPAPAPAPAAPKPAPVVPPVPRPAPVTPPVAQAPKAPPAPAPAAPIAPRPAPVPQTPKPTPVAPPVAPRPVVPPVAPPAPRPTPVPPPVVPPAPRPAPVAAPTPRPAPVPLPVVAPKPVTPPPAAPVPATPTPQAPSAPLPPWLQTPAATPTAPAPVQPSAPKAPTPAPMQDIPKTSQPAPIKDDKRDDDPPIAFIRAESINPGPQK